MRHLFVIMLLVVLCGCTTTKYVPVESVRTEYRDRETLRIDSVMMRDSVVIRANADTVWVEKWRWRDRTRLVIDTLQVIKTDSIAVPYPVEKELTRWQRAKQDWGGYAMSASLIAVLLSVGFIMYRFKHKY